MIGSSRKVRVWAYPLPADLRKSYDGLFGLVKNRSVSTTLRQKPGEFSYGKTVSDILSAMAASSAVSCGPPAVVVDVLFGSSPRTTRWLGA